MSPEYVRPYVKSVHTLTPLSLTIATASLAPAHCVAAPMSLLPRVETEVTLPAVASKYTAAPTANVTVAPSAIAARHQAWFPRAMFAPRHSLRLRRNRRQGLDRRNERRQSVPGPRWSSLRGDNF